jgi:hypothetical protein
MWKANPNGQIQNAQRVTKAQPKTSFKSLPAKKSASASRTFMVGALKRCLMRYLASSVYKVTPLALCSKAPILLMPHNHRFRENKKKNYRFASHIVNNTERVFVVRALSHYGI